MSFKDHFSSLAPDYSQFRPRYPKSLFEYLSSLVARHERAWDCGTGSGQAANGLVPFFDQVVATDASRQQIANAQKHERIVYLVSYSESVNIQSDSVDLVTTAQAIHWFKIDGFFKEVARVAREDGVVAVWAYRFIYISDPIDELLEYFHEKIIKQYWSAENRIVDEGLKSLPFPFDEIQTPEFEMEADWDLDHLIGFLGTWSAVKLFKEHEGTDPIKPIERELREAWGEAHQKRNIRWPLSLRVGRITEGVKESVK